MQKITPFLWFNNQAEEAMHFYLSIFKDSKAGHISYYGEGGPGPKGSVMVASFQLNGQSFLAMNGGPQFVFTPAISFVVNCDTQEEIDHFWEKLTADGGKPQPCGWLQDKFGLSWQVVPLLLGEYLRDKNQQKAGRVMEAMLKMQKIDIALLKKAYTDN
jgi:predicted 3-demethylubiquinone-9 3-methyltransferase (glyoxalase superfamily)